MKYRLTSPAEMDRYLQSYPHRSHTCRRFRSALPGVHAAIARRRARRRSRRNPSKVDRTTHPRGSTCGARSLAPATRDRTHWGHSFVVSPTSALRLIDAERRVLETNPNQTVIGGQCDAAPLDASRRNARGSPSGHQPRGRYPTPRHHMWKPVRGPRCGQKSGTPLQSLTHLLRVDAGSMPSRLNTDWSRPLDRRGMASAARGFFRSRHEKTRTSIRAQRT
jgi:hypothetical protein